MLNQNKLHKCILIWSLTTIIAFLGLGIHLYYQKEIFPTLTTPILMDKQEALKKTKERNAQSKLLINEKEAVFSAAFDTDYTTQNYITLKAGGNKTLNKLLQTGQIITSKWDVRVYTPKNIHQNFFTFSPNGKPYGFNIVIPETHSLPNITKQQAQELYNKYLAENPLDSINFSDYALKDYSHKIQNNGRKDHFFTFENTKTTIEKAKLKINITISGNQITEISPYIKLPEEFLRSYQEMRSYNQVVGLIGTIAIIAYFIIAITAIVYAWKKSALNWQGASIGAGSLALTTFLGSINFLPYLWFYYYPTSRSEIQFLYEYLTGLLPSLPNSFAMLGITFLAAEYLGRKAFPKHIQIWNWWKQDAAKSSTVAKQVFLGYLILGINLGYITIFYLTVLQMPGFWSPSYNLVNPNIISSYIPFFSPFANSLHAGIWEEFLFRAIPIASAVIIGKRYNKEKTFLAISLILQAVIFGMAHASYPQQPSYIRVIELSIPFFFWGFVYIKYGLLPIIVAHYSYDVFAMGEPIFFLSGSYVIIQKAAIIICIALPAIIVLIQRIRSGGLTQWDPIADKYLNENWQYPKEKEVITKTITEKKIPSTTSNALFFITLISFATTAYFYTQKTSNVTNDISISKSQAKKIAHEIAKKEIDTSRPWTITAEAKTLGDFNIPVFLNEKIGFEKTKQFLETKKYTINNSTIDLKRFLPRNVWNIRYAIYEGDQENRTEQLNVLINNSTDKPTIIHTLSENFTGKNISKQEAINIATQSLVDYKISPSIKVANEKWQIIQNSSNTTPSKRVDWTIKFKPMNIQKNATIDPRWTVTISGNKITNISSSLFIPEKWIEKNNEKNGIIYIITNTSHFATLITYIVILYFSVQSYAKNSKFCIPLYKVVLPISSLIVLSSLNAIPLVKANFSTSVPTTNQWLFFSFGILITAVLQVTLFALIFNFCIFSQKNIQKTQATKSIWIKGLCLGAILANTNLLSTIFSNNGFIYQSTENLNTFVPVLNNILSNSITVLFMIIISQSLVMILINANKKYWTSILILCAATCYYLTHTSLLDIYQIQLKLISFIAVVTIAYHYIIKLSPNIIPGTAAAFYTIYFLYPMIYNPSSLTNEISYCIYIVGILYISYFLTHLYSTYQQSDTDMIN